MSTFTGAERLEILGYEILHLISKGYKEDFDTIIKHLEDGTLMSYFVEKYKSELSVVSYDSPYDLNEWEKVLDEYSYLGFHHDVIRKMGIVNKDDGLLVLVFVILEIVSNRK